MANIVKKVTALLDWRRYPPLYANAFYLVARVGVTSLLGFIFWIVVARLYTSSEIGLVSALWAAAGLCVMLSGLGLNIGLIRFLPDAEDRPGMINSSLTIVSSLTLMIAVIFIIGLPFWSPALLFLRQDAALLISFFVFAVMSSFLSMQSGVFVALRSAGLSMWQQATAAGLKIVLVLILVSLGVLGLFSSWTMAIIVAALVGNLLMMRAQPGYWLRPVVKRKIVTRMLGFSIGNYFADGMGSIPIYVIPLVLIGLLGAEATAYFRIAYGIAVLLFTVPYAICTSLLVEGSHEPEQFRTNLLKVIRLVFPLLMVAVVLLFFFGDKILLLFGGEYSQNSLDLLRLLALSSIPLAVNEIYVVVKRMQLAIRPMFYLNLAVTALTLGLSYVLISRLGLIGIGIGWLAGQGLVALVVGTIMLRQFRKLS